MLLDELLKSLAKAFEEEPYAKKMGMRLMEIDYGKALVKIENSKDMNNLFGVIHGGVIFSLIDGAFELAANSYGTIAVALGVNVNYISPAKAGDTLYAEAKEVSKTPKISTYDIRVKNGDGKLIATCQATAYRKKDRLPVN
jgi:acyl-CoA thioesterase